MTNLSTKNNNNGTVLYVVQRCWHSGPQQYQPLDYLRLFQTQRDAEEAAYHSAHAWSKHVHNGREVAIKTLLLPSYPAHNGHQGSSYGFVASGTLFWVRALKATMVTARHHNQMMALCGDPNSNICHSQVYAILTEGVIGGTGNRNSRRGTEISEGRVFGGDASSHKAAMETMAHVQAGLEKQLGSHHYFPHVQVKTLPVGKPHEYASGSFLRDWPEQVLKPSAGAGIVDLHALHKRHHSEEEFWETQEEEGMVVDCPFEEPTAKRRRCIEASSAASGIENQSHSANDMFHGNGSGGLMVLRGGVFLGASTSNISHSASEVSDIDDVTMM
mmetsp:Transcript_751/g.1371  ORF Transcript_751/g.1371 Transcript_751/m.1371 type:complete len:330 (+) Transcript_751:296-1285(+)|eukprot:CAMPEP_0178755278 /NCGR_PEP_ID=MMETSP0744-20121128/12631_1 /TAXON_ID=913974 /ORGANISM="Nitzschia punctata, Strain CCMP561" /LENGTH=329 /DNA_ID=CAMNT_0020409293 /DNA_START=232 /DNA_END=1221 /DNA_ORIENTATION=-